MRRFLITFVCSSSLYAATHHPSDFLRNIEGSPHEGQAIVEHFCASCHAEDPEISIGAPRIRHAEDWKPRLKQGLSSLFQHADEGLNAMPPRGGCFECTDKQLMLAIKALLGKQDQKK